MEPGMMDKLVIKVGGKYRLVCLFQKRMRELVRGLPPLVETEGGEDLWDLAAREISEGKVELVMGEEAERMRRDLALREAEEHPPDGKAAAPAAAAEKKL